MSDRSSATWEGQPDNSEMQHNGLTEEIAWCLLSTANGNRLLLPKCIIFGQWSLTEPPYNTWKSSACIPRLRSLYRIIAWLYKTECLKIKKYSAQKIET